MSLSARLPPTSHIPIGSEFFSASTDGQVLWWDIRKLAEPTESLLMDPEKNNNPVGITVLDFETTMVGECLVIVPWTLSHQKTPISPPNSWPERKMAPSFCATKRQRVLLIKYRTRILVIMDLCMPSRLEALMYRGMLSFPYPCLEKPLLPQELPYSWRLVCKGLSSKVRMGSN
jgi:hypothetical protein